MRLNLKNLLLLSFLTLFTVFSCQDEVFEQTQEQDQTLQPNSTVVNLMQSASSNDGSVDNILDNSDCFSIGLPVTIIANGITITISTLEDLETLQDIFDEFEDDEDAFEFLFPITIIFNDYTEIVIENLEQLEAFIEECFDSSDDDDVIECVDFVYPISFSIFNTDFDLIETVTINSDEELYDFLEDLEDSDSAVIASLNYPVTLIYADGTTVTVNSNAELEAALNEAEEACDDDDDEEDCEIDELDAYLQTCHWELDEFAGQDVDLDIDFYFEANGAVIVKNEDTGEIVDGQWNTAETDAGIVLILDGLDGFAGDFNGEWLLIDCEDYEFDFVSNTGGQEVTMTLEKECEDETDCEVQEIAASLTECVWYTGSDQLPNNDNGPFTFDGDGNVYLAEAGTNAPIGSWALEVNDEGIFLTLEFSVNPYTEFNGTWLVIECDDDRIKVQMESGAYIVFEQDCENDNNNPFDCFYEDEIEECEENNDGVATFNLAHYLEEIDCDATYEASFHESEADAEANVNAIADTEAYVSESTSVFLRIEAANGEVEIYEIFLIVSDCGNDTCSEEAIDDYLQTCVWYVVNYNGDDNLIEFELDFVSPNEVVISGAGMTITAFWSTSGSEDGVVVTFDGIALPEIQAISGEWLVVECLPDRLELSSVNPANQNFMVLEQDCN